jgi:hypothetical protein
MKNTEQRRNVGVVGVQNVRALEEHLQRQFLPLICLECDISFLRNSARLPIVVQLGTGEEEWPQRLALLEDISLVQWSKHA